MLGSASGIVRFRMSRTDGFAKKFFIMHGQVTALKIGATLEAAKGVCGGGVAVSDLSFLGWGI